jgi:hypothetical protein
MVLVPLFEPGPQLTGFTLLDPKPQSAFSDAYGPAERDLGTTLEALVVLIKNLVLLRESEVAPL